MVKWCPTPGYSFMPTHIRMYIKYKIAHVHHQPKTSVKYQVSQKEIQCPGFVRISLLGRSITFKCGEYG